MNFRQKYVSSVFFFSHPVVLYILLSLLYTVLSLFWN